MPSSSKQGKRKRREKEDAVRKKTLFVANLSPETQETDIIDFFKDVAQVVRVQLMFDLWAKNIGYGYVEFASPNEAKEVLEKKNGEYLNCHKIILDEPSYLVEEVAKPKKTLFFENFPRNAPVQDIIDFFQGLAQVVRVRFIRHVKGQGKGRHLGCGFLEFSSANGAKKALQMKDREYLNYGKIYLDAPYRGATYLPPPKYCIDHKVWYEEDYIQPESLPREEHPAMEGLDKTPDFAEEVLLIGNLSPQTTKIMHIIHFFEEHVQKVVGKIVSVRLIVNHEGKHVGYGFVQFVSGYEAKKALEEKNGKYLHDHKIFLMKGHDRIPDFVKTSGTVRNKTLFVDNLSCQTEISDIINFFKDVAEVEHVRLFVDHLCERLGYGFVGFTSADEAKKALEKMNGEYLRDSKIILDVAENGVEYLEGTMYCIDHKVWYEDYLQRESLVVEEEVAAVEGVDETPDFAEELAVRKKTVFVDRIVDAKLSLSSIINFFNGVGKVIRVRLIVDCWGKHVGCCFIELATAEEAKKAVLEKNGDRLYLEVAEIDRPYPFRPKYKLADLVDKLWFDDNLLRKNLTKRSKQKGLMEQAKAKRIIFYEEQ